MELTVSLRQRALRWQACRSGSTSHPWDGSAGTILRAVLATSFLRMHTTFGLRAMATLALAWAAAAACVALHTPLPWMIGPLLATSLVSIAGGPTESWGPLRNAGQWTIGAALGLYFTPDVVALIGGLWWAIALGIVWALFLGWLFGAWLYRVHAPRMHGVPA